MNQSEYIDIGDNVFLHIRDWGKGHTIVFIPGWPFGHEMFEYQFTQLPQRGYRCIGISMRGFGKSSQPWGEYTYDIFADDLLSVLQALDLNNVTLAGFSMGGAIALHYMARHKGDRVDNLVLCSAAAPCFTSRAGFPFGLEPGVVDSLIKSCQSDRAKLNADFGTSLFRDSTAVTPPLLSWLQTLGMEASPHATAAALVTLRDSDLRNDLQSVQVPTVLFHGLHDRICPFELAKTMTAPTEAMPAGGEAMAVGIEAISAGEEPTAGGISGATLICFENSGHALFYEEKDKFNDELTNFIEHKSSLGLKYFGTSTR
ncbi:MAG: alpha/beta hydrolase [Geobacteraceae bacterium]|nr:alpha/beta hydrolase [Geobacteraceae bacterium]